MEWFRQLQGHYIIGAMQIFIGLLVFLQPTRGALTIIDDIYHMPVGFFGALTLIFGILLMSEQLTMTQYFAFTLPLVMYIVAATVYISRSEVTSYIPIVIYIGTYISLLRRFVQKSHERE